MNVYPLLYKPIFKERIWGGQRLHEVFGKDLPADKKIGESWEIADVGDDKSVVINGPLAGQTIDAVLAEFGPAITGNDSYHPPFGLLIKILDAEDVLSVQVHPDADAVRRMGKGEPKTECWYILDAQPGAVIYKGLKAGTTREQFAQSIKDGTCADYLNKVTVQAGECHFLPSGTCHAIGAGLLIAEIQQPSDTTYRVFDWNRVDPDTGKYRQLHIDEALEAIHFDTGDEDLPVTRTGRLVDADVFTVDKGHQMPGCEVLLSGQMKVLMIISGTGRIVSEKTQTTAFKKGDTLLIPAAFEGVMQFETECEYLSTMVG